MKKPLVALVFIALIALTAQGGQALLDPADSLKVRQILDEIGWNKVAVRDVTIDSGLTTSSFTHFGTGRVTLLNLSARAGLPLISSLPLGVSKLAELSTLLLNGNQLTQLPRELLFLRRLSRLEIGNNRFRTLPEWLGKLNGLVVLRAHTNQLTSLPDSLGLAAMLHTLKLSGNELTSLPPWIGTMPALRVLLVDNNRIGSLPLSLTRSSLMTVDFSFNQLCSLEPGLIEWVDKYQLVGSRWRFSQQCDNPDSQTIVTVVDTATDTRFSWYTSGSQEGTPLIRSNESLDLPGPLEGWVVLKAVVVSAGSAVMADGGKFLIEFSYGDLQLDSVDLEKAAICIVATEGKWEYLGGQTNTQNKTISAVIGDYGTYGLLAPRSSSAVRSAQPLSFVAGAQAGLSLRKGELVVSLVPGARAQLRIVTLGGKEVLRTGVQGAHTGIPVQGTLAAGSYLAQLGGIGTPVRFAFIVR